MTMKPFGTFPTAYGCKVVVHHDDTSADPGEFQFTMDATARCCGIYDKAARERFVADACRLGHMPKDLDGYGGSKVLHLPLPRPSAPVYPGLPKGEDIGLPIEKWVDRLIGLYRWCDRAEAIETEILAGNLANMSKWQLPTFIPALGLQLMLTAALENLAEKEIDCLEAAAFYALTSHDAWREVGSKWLRPHAHTWLADWVRDRPNYRRLASMLREDDADLPEWLAGGAA